ncbi:Endonuclease, Uma2 family (restriction endonuclease fold) [Streptomyces sp. 2224.1]|uniref:Uma2 family endonuclease n=1 Tax=unclassified Streptomyces TaxID=2593676 RepID=UPI0008842677|nr:MULTISPECIES: Uma2 family endonuclease [unclassified Streptomyces]PBC84839.1 Uma2 family endonuclease [Streptomyces sp. 2321.6]SDR25849.1 Endonuclease, Uma2 family (restriction endonuclease fold) [Streptomyces sp. KS_16]SEB60648.1 Endonuclease, Uma2 family (restriction endonuclease fold) [Streptomyces sp. 2224.1]SED46430.1 Endonuclease, Uma2 family (restriction endonuclease fold) [Streptomyces sp. 2133.1]SNC70862.1 Endonuclease, Uma2 family (restriction endonuclease fold) [Streptomyces sp. 
MTALPDWMRPPRAEGWFAEDLDRLPEAPRHTELIDGALVFAMSPQRWWHGHLVTMLTVALMEQAPAGVRVGREMTIKLDQRNRPEPDLLVTTADYEGDRTWFAPEEVQLVVEVVSPESAHRVRTVKLRKYAEAGIRHYWCIEDEDTVPAVHVYELDEPTRSYAPAGIFRHTLQRSLPFEINLDLDKLAPGRSG